MSPSGNAMCVYHAICICSYTGSAYISGSISVHSDLLYNLSLAMTLTLSAIVLHQDEHSIVLGQGPTTQKPRVQKRPAGAVMKKPAAWSAKPATGSASSIAKRPSAKVLKKPAAGSAKAATRSASIVKRPSAKVLKKPAAGSAARNYNSPPNLRVQRVLDRRRHAAVSSQLVRHHANQGPVGADAHGADH